MRRPNGSPKDKRMHSCPQCDKRRMIRDIDHELTLQKQQYKTKNNSTIELFIDICESCKVRNWRKHFEPTKSDVKRVLKTIQEEGQLSEEESLEDLL